MYFIFMSIIFSTISNNYVFCNGTEDDDIAELMSFDAFNFLPELNPNETHDGRPIIEGDIALPFKETDDRKGVRNTTYLWPDGEIYYRFDDAVLDSPLEKMVRYAMKEWEKHTCLVFRAAAQLPPDVSSEILIHADKEGCWSDVGKIGLDPKKKQDLSLGKGCNRDPRVILHELGHAIGFYHEQSRSDRDGYIHFLWNNVKTSKKFNFDLKNDDSRHVEYDYTSIMHYRPMVYSSKPMKKNTMVALNPLYQTLIGSGEKISFRDAKLANLMYNCSNGCPNENSTKCKNGGYLFQTERENSNHFNVEDRANCSCVCPPNTSGNLCENANQPLEYYDKLPCGGNITKETEIETPGYPSRILSPGSCTWWIQAPEGKRPTIEFIGFSFHPRKISRIKKYNNTCFHERVEIRMRNRYEGRMFCGEDIKPGTKATSPSQEIIIIIDTNEKAEKRGKGLKAKISFVEAK